MRFNLITLFVVFLSLSFSAQTIKLHGNIQDTTAGGLMSNSVLMATKFKDSTLVGFSRTDKKGFFNPIKIPVDTYLVIISNPNFSDKTYLLVPNKGDSVFNFKNVMLPPKSILLNEVEIVAHKEKMYYKGDTLMFTADSFKLKQEATVEDLLKKLPGVKVDAKGKITVQGKEVSQVLVDGDEFFGSDPTIATKNLNANTVETVQVYEKKNEDPDAKDETMKVMNLQLKDEAKKGYFGKISAASDAQKFYEGELLMNKFKNAQKISLFGLIANTPKQAFGWDDAYKYGVSNGDEMTYDPDNNSWISYNYNDGKSGVPQTLKGGFYYNDKIGKKIKLNTDYTFKQNSLVSAQETNTQYFLDDTTYTNKQTVNAKSANEGHVFNLRWTQNLDSLTELVVRPKINYNTSSNSNYQEDDFISADNILTRETNIFNKGNTTTTDANVQLKLTRNFKKKDRMFSVTYQPTYYTSVTKSELETEFNYYLGQSLDSLLKQKRTTEAYKTEHNATLTYVEPITKKIKIELGYTFSQNENNNNRKTLDFDGLAYDAINTSQTNDFRNHRTTNKAGAKIIYEVKKYRFSLGANYRNVFQENLNATTGQRLGLSVNNILPTASASFRINQGSNLNMSYNLSAQLPDLKQMQPVIDNTDPNNIQTGNPNLRQQYTNNANLNYYFYKGISDINFYMGANYNNTIDEVNDKTYFDSIGRSISTPTNVSGNYYGSVYLGGGLPVFNKLFKIDYSFNASTNNNVGFVNDQVNITQNTSFSPGLTFEKEMDETEITIGGNYNYNIPKQTISVQSNKPYYSYELEATFRTKVFDERLYFFAEAKYTNNGNRAVGYNINFVIINANISYSFLKAKNLIIGFDANDILNQNINNQRNVQTNKIVDTKTQIIRQYFLGRITYKFNSKAAKEEEVEFD